MVPASSTAMMTGARERSPGETDAIASNITSGIVAHAA